MEIEQSHGTLPSGIQEQLMAVACEEQAIELIKESLAEAETESDYDSSVTHAFIVLGASVSLILHRVHSIVFLWDEIAVLIYLSL